jgi:hypothetical protein
MKTETETKKAATEFLALSSANRSERVRQALDLLVAASEGAPLYNREYQDAKDLLGRVVEEAWTAQVMTFVRMGHGAESALSWHVGAPYNLHSVLSLYKKMNQLKASSTLNGGLPFSDVNPEMVKAIRTMLDAAHPIALMVKNLKNVVIKGHKPAPRNPETVAKEAAKKTCQCCFRAMVVKGGRIVKHGWQESGNRRQGQYGNAWHVGECPGTGYEPFEVSCERTKWYAEELRKMRADRAELVEQAMDPARRPAKLHYEKRVGNFRDGYREETLWVEDDGATLEMEERGYRNYGEAPKYADLLRTHVRNLQNEMKVLDLNIADLEKRIADWRAQ